MSRQVAWFRPSLLDGSWRIVPAIWGTVLVEAALPVLLAVRRTRLVGLAVGTTFSAVLALAGNAPFSALALSVYVVFLPSGAPTYLRTRVKRRPGIVRWAGRGAGGGRRLAPWWSPSLLGSSGRLSTRRRVHGPLPSPSACDW